MTGDHDDADVESGKRTHGSTRGDINRKSILVVDDDDKIRRILRQILAYDAYNVLECANGREALETLERASVDLVLTDIRMPELDGISLLTELRRLTHSIPVVVISGETSVKAIVQCMKIGAVDFVSKPFTVQAVKDVVASVFRRRFKSPRELQISHIAAFHPWLKSKFTLVDRIGEGGMGVIYCVQLPGDPSGRRYALKVFKAQDGRGAPAQALRERFLREAKAAASVSHPSIVRIFGYGFERDVMDCYILMEFIAGRSLADLIYSGTHLALSSKIEMLARIADGLEAIHAAGILHRDIKPANVLVDDDHNVKITDFGVARLPDSDLTKVTEIIGSPSYMAPERFDSGSPDPRSDIFSLGVLGFELFLGLRPFTGETIFELSDNIRKIPHPHPQDIDDVFPDALTKVLDGMLAKRPEQRYARAAEISADLRAAAQTL